MSNCSDIDCDLFRGKLMACDNCLRHTGKSPMEENVQKRSEVKEMVKID